jgi:hypothetical protein
MYKNPKFVRMSISVPSATMTWLQAEAHRLGIPVADVVRRIFDQARVGDQRAEVRRAD